MNEDEASALSTVPKPQRVIGKPFQPGNNANPAGRPKGSRNKFQENFCAELCQAFEEGGAEAMRTMMRDEPSKFIQACVQLIPKQVEVSELGKFGEMSDEEVALFITAASKKLQEQRKLVALN